LVVPKYISSTDATLVTTTKASIRFHGLHGDDREQTTM
jgi:hypothetical protein